MGNIGLSFIFHDSINLFSNCHGTNHFFFLLLFCCCCFLLLFFVVVVLLLLLLFLFCCCCFFFFGGGPYLKSTNTFTILEDLWVSKWMMLKYVTNQALSLLPSYQQNFNVTFLAFHIQLFSSAVTQNLSPDKTICRSVLIYTIGW